MIVNTIMMRENLVYTNLGCFYLWLFDGQPTGIHKAQIGDGEQAYLQLNKLTEDVTPNWEGVSEGWEEVT